MVFTLVKFLFDVKCGVQNTLIDLLRINVDLVVLGPNFPDLPQVSKYIKTGIKTLCIHANYLVHLGPISLPCPNVQIH